MAQALRVLQVLEPVFNHALRSGSRAMPMETLGAHSPEEDQFLEDLDSDDEHMTEEVVWGDMEPLCCEVLGDDTKIRHWQRYGGKGVDASSDVFGYHQVTIANHGGFDSVDKLLSYYKYLYVLSKVALISVNCYTIAQTDIAAALGEVDADTAEATGGFLLTQWICLKVFGHVEHLHRSIQVFELAYMLYTIAAILSCLLLALAAPWCSRWNGHPVALNRWSYVEGMFWGYCKELESYSALKLLYYVHPQVLMLQGFDAVLHAYEVKGCWLHFLGIVHLFAFILSRMFFLIIGFDSFLVKLRITAHYAMAKEATPYSFLMIALFLFQVIGASKMQVFVQERLFLFIFGGKDGQLDHDEKMLVEVWKALLARKIFHTYGIARGCIVMLGYDDYDFQYLALDDNEVAIRQAEDEAEQAMEDKDD